MFLRRTLILVLICMIGATSVAAEAGRVRIRGEVLDAVSGEPLPARVYIQGQDGTWYFAEPASEDGTAVPYRKQYADRSVEMHTTVSAHPFIMDLPEGTYKDYRRAG